MRFTKTLVVALSIACTAGTVFTSCKKKSGCTDSAATNFNAEADKDDGTCTYADKYAELKMQIKENYAAIVFATYEDSYNEAVQLQTAINTFIANPTSANFTACRTAWKEAREPYGQTEAFRFSSGPIDDADGPEGMLNAWPLDENYIDYVTGMPNAGVINNQGTYPTIDKALLESLNEAGGEANISAGYHAIEFLLWGQDDPNAANLNPGQRPYTDYVTGGTASNQGRRGQYLKAAIDLLVDGLGSIKDEWDPAGSGNYRAEFLALSNDKALQNILTGIGTLSKSELAGERMFVALDNQDQEDEHSCFSDNTHRDIILNAQGISNVYNGTYTRVNSSVVSGKSIKDLITAVNATLAGEMNTLSTTSMTKVNAITPPFDYRLTQEASGGSGPIMQAINSLKSQGDKFAEVAAALGITINTELPQ